MADDPKPGLEADQLSMRKDVITRNTNPEVAKARKNLKRQAAANKHGDYIEILRRTAREMGQFGPITIDAVSAALAEKLPVMPIRGDPTRTQKWKGAVFSTGEWKCVGYTTSTMAAANGRPVKLWALKTWLANNTMNGDSRYISAFSMEKIFRDFRAAHPEKDITLCRWLIGVDRLATSVTQMVSTESGKLFQIPVQWVPNSVGAMIIG